MDQLVNFTLKKMHCAIFNVLVLYMHSVCENNLLIN